MNRYDEELRKLEGEAVQVNQLDNRLNRLTEQKRRLQKKEAELATALSMEEEDVERLEGRSLSRFLCLISGKLDEKLDREKQEAYEAAIKHDAVLREMEALDADIGKVQAAIREAKANKQRYEQLLREKREAIMYSGLPEADEILNIEKTLGYLSNQKREINEAISAGRAAQSIADQVTSSLDSAKGWSTWDLLGGGIVADLAKHSDLDDAQRQVENLQIQLERFRTELADVAVHSDLKVSIDGGLRFADYFFDGLFADWAVYNRIENSQGRVQETERQISKAIYQLKELLKAAEQDEARLQEKLEQIIRRTGAAEE